MNVNDLRDRAKRWKRERPEDYFPVDADAILALLELCERQHAALADCSSWSLLARESIKAGRDAGLK